MGMDGLSMANTGAIKESTSAELTNRTEQVVQQNPTNDSKQVQTLATNQRVKEKEEEEESGKKKKNENAEEEFQDGFQEEPNEANPDDSAESEEEKFQIEELDNPNKDFYVKLNSKDDIIELYDSSTDRLIETISGNELSELVKRLNMASGIFVNKKV